MGKREEISSEQFAVSGEESGTRLDLFLPRALSRAGLDLSRSRVQELIKSGGVELNGRTVKPRTPVEEGDTVRVVIPEERSTELLPEAMELAVLFEDDHVIVIDKPSGLVVHPGAGNESGTLVNALLHHCEGALSRLADEGRPGIVHRLDRETSGCLVAAKSDLAYESLVAQFSSRETGKSYVAIAAGIPEPREGRIENRIGRHPVSRQRMTVLEPPAGKEAITEYRVSHSDPGGWWSWIDCDILTGRTHQIRVHLKESLHCPILGDSIYSQPRRQKVEVDRLLLHARVLRFRHPESGENLRFEAPLPPAFAPFLPGNTV